MRAETIARALRGRRSGSAWMACCPIHEGDGRAHNPSLSIRDAADDRVLVHCFAGCEPGAVIAALRVRGLWPERENREHPSEWGRIVRTYDYSDEDGRLLYQVCRFEPKTFRPRRPDGRGGWKWGYGNVRRVLYRLPEVIEAPIVFVVEGERDVETLRSWGFAATTNAGGANGWRPEFAECLRGRECILIPDHDAPGIAWAKTVATSLLGKAARICVLWPLPALKGKDITDWFAEGHSELELIELVERDLPQEAAKNGS